MKKLNESFSKSMPSWLKDSFTHRNDAYSHIDTTINGKECVLYIARDLQHMVEEYSIDFTKANFIKTTPPEQKPEEGDKIYFYLCANIDTNSQVTVQKAYVIIYTGDKDSDENYSAYFGAFASNISYDLVLKTCVECYYLDLTDMNNIRVFDKDKRLKYGEFSILYDRTTNKKNSLRDKSGYNIENHSSKLNKALDEYNEKHIEDLYDKATDIYDKGLKLIHSALSNVDYTDDVYNKVSEIRGLKDSFTDAYETVVSTSYSLLFGKEDLDLIGTAHSKDLLGLLIGRYNNLRKYYKQILKLSQKADELVFESLNEDKVALSEKERDILGFIKRECSDYISNENFEGLFKKCYAEFGNYSGDISMEDVSAFVKNYLCEDVLYKVTTLWPGLYEDGAEIDNITKYTENSFDASIRYDTIRLSSNADLPRLENFIRVNNLVLPRVSNLNSLGLVNCNYPFVAKNILIPDEIEYISTSQLGKLTSLTETNNIYINKRVPHNYLALFGKDKDYIKNMISIYGGKI